MAFLRSSSLIFLAGCAALVIFASTHPHDARGTWISTGAFVPRAQDVFSKAINAKGDSFVSVWYNGEILIGYLGETDTGVLSPVPLEQAIRIKTPEHDGFQKGIVAQNPKPKSGHRNLGLVFDGSPDMRSRLVLGPNTLGHIPATELEYCEAGHCHVNSTYSSQIWHVDRASREIMPAFTSGDQETDLGVVFEQQWKGELNLALKDVYSETLKYEAIEFCNLEFCLTSVDSFPVCLVFMVRVLRKRPTGHRSSRDLGVLSSHRNLPPSLTCQVRASTSPPPMYPDSTDAPRAPSVEHNSPRLPTSSSPPTQLPTPGSSYPPRSTSFQTSSQLSHPSLPHHSNSNGTGAAHSPSIRSQTLGPQSPPNGAANVIMKAGTPPPSVSPSPRQSEDVPFGIPAGQQHQHHPPPHVHYQPSRRNSMPRSVASGDPIPSQYAPTVELEEPSTHTGFDEGVLRALCDLDCGVPLLLDRIKQSMLSCREVSLFLKKRAVVEDEYGRTLQKTARSAHEAYAVSDGKAGTFVTAWQSTMKLHDVIAENRLKFAARLNEMSEDLANLAKEVEKNRKATKDLATRYERGLQESEMALEKAKARFDSTHEELERILLAKEGESMKDGTHNRSGGPSGKRVIGKAVAKGGLLLKGKNPASIAKQEEDVRQRMSAYSDAFRKAVLETQAMRQEYFNFQLPRILRSLKECADEIDLGTQYHLSRYAFLFESIVLNDGSTISPTGGIEDGPGLKPIMESIDNRQDFKVYMQNYAIATNRPTGPRREGPWEEGFAPTIPRYQQPDAHHRIPNSDTSRSMANPNGTHSPATNGAVPNGTTSHEAYPPAIAKAMQQYPDRGRPTFGVQLEEQMIRDNLEVPRILEKCCEAIETYGLSSMGIFRLSGTNSKVQKLKVMLDRDIDAVDLMHDEWRMDVNNVTSVLKLWLRELPEPLLTFDLYQGYIDAAKEENERLRQIQLHHRVNDLPDPNYATLKFLMGHLHKVLEQKERNGMSPYNLSVVFGPTLLGPSPTAGANTDGQAGGGTTLQDMHWQCKAIETILEHYADIFVDESEAVGNPP
ncbi:hypothetical protein FRB90_001831 [Tulasnella sp. 427]|nr:hypothetical protein FRB90_001831 [Tulasnella sp. 427]